MTTVAEAVRRLRIVQTYETPGADQAIRRGREFAAANREIASTSVSVERLQTATERAYARTAAQIRQQTVVLREGAAAQRLIAAAKTEAGNIASPLIGVAAGYAGYAAAAAAIGLLVRSSGDAVEAYRKFEDSQVTIQNVLRATDGAAGRTAGQINNLVNQIGNIGEARQAAQALLTFGGISSTVFDDSLRAAKDLSAIGFGDLTASARALGQALSNPEQGLTALEAAGIRLGARQKAIIVDMMETGRAAEAQRMTLDLLNQKIGGAGAARDATLSGAYTALSDAMERGSEQFGENIVQATRLVAIIQALASVMNAINDFKLSEDATKFLRAISTMPLVGPIAIAARAVLPSDKTGGAASRGAAAGDAKHRGFLPAGSPATAGLRGCDRCDREGTQGDPADEPGTGD